jgi:hypothetical protein
MSHLGKTFDQRFWSKVNKTPTCWVWTACVDKMGYGRFYVAGKKRDHPHRISWAMKNGPIPKGMFVLHKCDNPPCVNPDHLILGTHLENMQDRDRKGRGIKGRKKPTISPETKETIFKKHIGGQSYASLVNEYKIAARTVQRICQERRNSLRTHVKEDK